MEADLDGTSQDVPLSTARGHLNVGLLGEHAVQPAACMMCRRMFAPDNDDLEIISVCGDCKFLLLEDLGDSANDSIQRRQRRVRRTRYSSSESIENIFSQQLSHMINLARHNHSAASGHEHQSADGDASVRLLQHTSSLTTPTGSRRWRRVSSDTESEGFGNMDSPYGENETTPGASWYRTYHGESDAISFSAYGGDSDVSVDENSLFDTEMFNHQDEESNLDSDTDIDPMNAGINQWNTDDEDEEEEEEDGEWEEADIEEDTIESVDGGPLLQNFLISSPYERNGSVAWPRLFDSPEPENLGHWRVRHGRQTYNRDIFANLEVSELAQYAVNPGDYLGPRGFEELLEHLADTDISRRGAPPAAASFVKNLPRVIINEEHDKHDGLACAICKDVLTIGAEVNQLPCLHFYHPSCILPWLSARNSCPLCRFELPTDDTDYEERKRSNEHRLRIHEIQQQDANEDSSSDDSDGAEADEAREFVQGEEMEEGEILNVEATVSYSGREGNRRHWLLLAAAPIVSLVGIALVFCLRNSRGRQTRNCNFPRIGVHQLHVPSSSTPTQRANRSWRWWSLF